MNESVGITLDVLPGTLGGITAALGGFNELVAATSLVTSAVAQSTSAVDSMLLTLGIGLVGAGAEAAKAAGEVTQAMKIVQSVSGQTSSEISVLTQQANEFSVRYKMGIDEVTEGLQTLGRAGLSSVNTQLDTLKAGMEAAKVTGMELGEVLNKLVQTTSLLGGDINSSSFGLQTQDMASKLLATSQSAPIDVNDVVQTLSYSGGTAAAGGINIYNEDAMYDYLGAIAAFGQKGVAGSMAGTALRAFFTKPASQSSQVTDALGKLKMKPEDLWEPGEQAMRPVSEQIGLIQGQMNKLKISQMDQIELWGEIVSPKMGQQMLKLNKNSIRELADDIRHTESAEKLAQNTMNSYISDLNTLTQKGAEQWREYGKAALAWFSPLVKGLNMIMDLLGTDIGGFPIIQQVVKGGIILVISQVIQRLGSVWTLLKGIANEIRAQLQSTSQVARAHERTEQELRQQYEEMGLTEGQAKRLAQAASDTKARFSESNAIMAEFLAQLNKAVALMGKLSSLSQINSMKMIGNMTGQQYANYYSKAKMNPGQWYNYDYRTRGDLTKTDFAKLSLRHGLSQDELQQIYYGTHKTHGAGLYRYALQEQKSSGYNIESAANKKAFITATTFEKYLQQNKMGMYDPKINPMMGVVQHIDANTNVIAKEMGATQASAAAQANKTATNTSQNAAAQNKNAEKEIKDKNIIAEKTKQESAEKEIHKRLEEDVELRTRMNQIDRTLLNQKTSELEINRRRQADLNRRINSRFSQYQSLSAAYPGNQIQSNKNMMWSLAGATQSLHQKNALLEKQLDDPSKHSYTRNGKTYYFNSLVDQTMKKNEAISQQIVANNKQIAQNYEKLAALNKETLALEQEKIGIERKIVPLALDISRHYDILDGLKTEEIMLEHEHTQALNRIKTQATAITAELDRERSIQASITSNSAHLNAIIANSVQTKRNTATILYDEELLEYDMRQELMELIGSTQQSSTANQAIVNEQQGIRGAISKIKSLIFRQQSEEDKIILTEKQISEARQAELRQIRHKIDMARGPYGLAGANAPSATYKGNTMTRFSIPLGTTPDSIYSSTSGAPLGLRQIMMNSYFASMMGRGNYKEGTGLRAGFKNWFFNAGMTSMINRDALKSTTSGLTGFKKALATGASAIGSFGMMFGPAEVALLGFSMGMQAIEKAHQKYNEELEKINSKLAEAREKFEEAEDAFLEAYTDENNGKVTQDQKDEALLNLYANGPGDRNDGLDSYRARVFTELTKIEGNTREKARKEQDTAWGSHGWWAKTQSSLNDSDLARQINRYFSYIDVPTLIASTLNPDDFNPKDQAMMDEFKENFKSARETAAANDELRSEIDNSRNFKQNLESNIGFQGKDYRLNESLSNYASWIDNIEDYSEQAKYATALMESGMDSTGVTGGSEVTRIGLDTREYKAFEQSLKKIPDVVRTQIEDSINADPDFYKSMQRQLFTFENGKLKKNDNKESKILEAIRRRVGNITEEQARQTLILSTLSSIHEFVQNQIQPQLLSNVEAGWMAANTMGLTYTSGGFTGSMTDAIYQGVVTMVGQLGSILEQRTLENMSLLAEAQGIDMADLTDLALANRNNSYGLTQWAHGYSKEDAKEAEQILGSAAGLYSGVLTQTGTAPEEAYKKGQELFWKNVQDNTENGQVSINSIFRTWEPWMNKLMTPYIMEQWMQNQQDTAPSPTGAKSSGKDKDKNKDKSDSSNRKNWVNLAICNKKEIPKLNVNLFKKPPNFTILNRNFKLRDVNVNTADDAKSIQNAVKNSIIEIQNRSNPKIIQDDAAEYDPLSATEGNNLPVGSKKTE